MQKGQGDGLGFDRLSCEASGIFSALMNQLTIVIVGMGVGVGVGVSET